jgi:hypothetical protein
MERPLANEWCTREARQSAPARGRCTRDSSPGPGVWALGSRYESWPGASLPPGTVDFPPKVRRDHLTPSPSLSRRARRERNLRAPLPASERPNFRDRPEAGATSHQTRRVKTAPPLPCTTLLSDSVLLMMRTVPWKLAIPPPSLDCPVAVLPGSVLSSISSVLPSLRMSRAASAPGAQPSSVAAAHKIVLHPATAAERRRLRSRTTTRKATTANRTKTTGAYHSDVTAVRGA